MRIVIGLRAMIYSFNSTKLLFGLDFFLDECEQRSDLTDIVTCEYNADWSDWMTEKVKSFNKCEKPKWMLICYTIYTGSVSVDGRIS